jgi:microcompartment protein CcmL/EutN
MRDYIVGLETNNKMLSGRLSKVEGHIGSLKQALDAAKAAKAAGGDAPSDSQIRRAQGDPKKFEALKDEYPEFADAIEGYLSSALEGVRPGEKVDVSKLRDELAGEFDNRLNRKFEELRVETHHRGWQKTTTSPEFVGWVQRQPREVQVLYASPHSDDVIRLLDLYSEVKQAVTKQADRLSSAAALNSNSPAPSRQKGWDDMTPEEQWNFLAQQDAAATRR